MKKTISFKQYLNIQIRYLQFVNYKTSIEFVTLAELFAKDLCCRLSHKYIIKRWLNGNWNNNDIICWFICFFSISDLCVFCYRKAWKGKQRTKTKTWEIIMKLMELINNLKNGWKLCNSEDLETIQYLAICILFPCVLLLLFLLTN